MSLEEMILRDELRRKPATPEEIRRLVGGRGATHRGCIQHINPFRDAI